MKRKTTRAQKQEDDRNIKSMVRTVNEAEDAFLRRWPASSLALCDQQLYIKLNEQIAWFRESSIVHPDHDRIIEEGSAALRGLDVATSLMETSALQNIIQWSPDLGGSLVISHAIDDPADLTIVDGKDVIITPAEIISWLLAYPDLLALKREWPRAVMQFRKTEDPDDPEAAQVDVMVDSHGEVVVDQRVI